LFYKFLKILLFLENNLKQKSPSANAKGLEMSGSPGRTTFATFA